MSSRLNPDDQKHVEEYLLLPQHQVEHFVGHGIRQWPGDSGLLSRLLSYLAL